MVTAPDEQAAPFKVVTATSVPVNELKHKLLQAVKMTRKV